MKMSHTRLLEQLRTAEARNLVERVDVYEYDHEPALAPPTIVIHLFPNTTSDTLHKLVAYFHNHEYETFKLSETCLVVYEKYRTA